MVSSSIFFARPPCAGSIRLSSARLNTVHQLSLTRFVSSAQFGSSAQLSSARSRKDPDFVRGIAAKNAPNDNGTRSEQQQKISAGSDVMKNLQIGRHIGIRKSPVA
jgi:hypothetical protein